MAGKISELGVLTAAGAAPADLFEVLDVSDTTMAASGTNKRFPLAELGSYLNPARVTGIPYRVAALKGMAGVPTPNGLEQAWTTACHLVWLPGVGNKLTSISVEVKVAGSSGSVLRLGVYTANPGVLLADPTTLVGPLIVDGGLVAADTTGTRTISGLSIPIPRQGLFLALAFQGTMSTSAQIRTVDAGYGPGNEPVGAYSTGDIRGGSWGFYPSGWVNPGTGALPTQPANVSTNMAGIGWLVPDWIVTFSA